MPIVFILLIVRLDQWGMFPDGGAWEVGYMLLSAVSTEPSSFTNHRIKANVL